MFRWSCAPGERSSIRSKSSHGLDAADVLGDREPVVGLAVEREQVEHRVLADRGREAPRMVAEQPVRHVARRRRGRAGRRGRASPSPSATAQSTSRMQVGVVGLAPVALDRLREGLAVADRAARVAVEDGEAGVGERDHLEPRRGPVREVRAAVDLQHEAPCCAAHAAGRPRHRRRARPGGGPHGAPDPCDTGRTSGRRCAKPPQVAVLDRVDLARAAVDARDRRHPAAARPRARCRRVVALDQRSTEPSSPKRYGTQPRGR